MKVRWRLLGRERFKPIRFFIWKHMHYNFFFSVPKKPRPGVAFVSFSPVHMPMMIQFESDLFNLLAGLRVLHTCVLIRYNEPALFMFLITV